MYVQAAGRRATILQRSIVHGKDLSPRGKSSISHKNSLIAFIFTQVDVDHLSPPLKRLGGGIRDMDFSVERRPIPRRDPVSDRSKRGATTTCVAPSTRQNGILGSCPLQSPSTYSSLKNRCMVEATPTIATNLSYSLVRAGKKLLGPLSRFLHWYLVKHALS